MKTISVAVDGITVLKRHRFLDENKVASLAASMGAIGLRQPISVWIEGEGEDVEIYLVAGLHRLEAAKQLGWQDIDAIEVTLDPIDRELWEIDENLCRAELTEAQEAQHLARRKELWEARETANKLGQLVPVSGGRGNKGFASETAAVTGQDKRTINRKIARAEKIESEVLKEVEGTNLDKGTVLDELAKTSRDKQHAKVIEIRDRSETAKLNKYADEAVARSDADEAATIVHANMDLDTVDQLMARLASVKMKDFLAALSLRRAA